MKKVNDSKTKQLRWTSSMERTMLEVLAEEARKGNKPSNTFKVGSYQVASQAICEKFGIECTTDHVENHMKTVKKTWNIISTLKGKSGFGWDNNMKMIIAGPKEYDEEVTAHSAHEKFLNKKIEMYDEMALVVGKDAATGSFAKGFLDIDSVDGYSVNLEDEDLEEVSKGKGVSSTGGLASQSKSSRKRSRSTFQDDENFEKLYIEIGEVAKAIKALNKNELDVNILYEEIMKIEGFDENELSDAFDYLVENEKTTKAFLAKNVNLKKLWITNFLARRTQGK